MRRLAVSLLAVFGVLVVAVLLYAAFHWQPDRPVEALVARWAKPPSYFLPLDGMSVHLRDEGERSDPLPILLLHGTSASLHTWDGWTAALLPRRVIRVDLPGFGLTGPRPDGDYSYPAYLRFLRNLLDALGVRRCIVAGNSFGGSLAWQLALEDPTRVAGLILVDAGGYPSASQSIPLGFRIARMPVLNRLAASVLPRSLIEESLRNVYGDPARIDAELIDRYFEITLREGNRRAVVERFRQAKFGDRHQEIRKITQPTLILWGEKDRLIPPENAQNFHRDIRGSSLHLFPELGHVPHEEDPATTVAPVRVFLDRMQGI